MLTTRAWVSRKRCRMTAEPMKPAPPVTKIVEPLKLTISKGSHCRMPAPEGAGYRHQIFAIAALGALLRRRLEGLERDVALAQRNLLWAGDACALPLLQDLHEVAGFDQRRVGSGIEPGEAAAQHLDEQIAAFEIGPVDVSDLELATSGGLYIGRDVQNVIVVEIEAGHRDIRFRLLRLLLDRQRATGGSQFHDAVLLGRVDDIAEDGCA